MSANDDMQALCDALMAEIGPNASPTTAEERTAARAEMELVWARLAAVRRDHQPSQKESAAQVRPAPDEVFLADLYDVKGAK